MSIFNCYLFIVKTLQYALERSYDSEVYLSFRLLSLQLIQSQVFILEIRT